MKNLIIRFRELLFSFLTPILKVTAIIHAPWTHKKVTGEDYFKIWPILKPGTIFVTKIRGDLTDILVPGYYSHAAIYCPKPGATLDEIVVQAERDGVGTIDLVSFLTSKDDVLVLEPNCLGDKKDAVMARAAEIAAGLIGDPYDFHFSYQSTPTSFYCSRVVWYAYDKACEEFGLPSLFTPVLELGELVVTPQQTADTKTLSVIYHAGGTNSKVS